MTTAQFSSSRNRQSRRNRSFAISAALLGIAFLITVASTGMIDPFEGETVIQQSQPQSESEVTPAEQMRHQFLRHDLTQVLLKLRLAQFTDIANDTGMSNQTQLDLSNGKEALVEPLLRHVERMCVGGLMTLANYVYSIGDVSLQQSCNA